jgi:hypothetical protein
MEKESFYRSTALRGAERASERLREREGAKGAGTNVYLYVYICVCVCTHTHTHTHIYIYLIYTYISTFAYLTFFSSSSFYTDSNFSRPRISAGASHDFGSFLHPLTERGVDVDVAPLSSATPRHTPPPLLPRLLSARPKHGESKTHIPPNRPLIPGANLAREHFCGASIGKGVRKNAESKAVARSGVRGRGS